jgi:hypothetical protein
LDLGLDVVKVGDMKESARLLANGPHHPGMTVTQAVHPNPHYEIQISIPFTVPDVGTLSPHQANRKPGIGLGNISSCILHPWLDHIGLLN